MPHWILSFWKSTGEEALSSRSTWTFHKQTQSGVHQPSVPLLLHLGKEWIVQVNSMSSIHIPITLIDKEQSHPNASVPNQITLTPSPHLYFSVLLRGNSEETQKNVTLLRCHLPALARDPLTWTRGCFIFNLGQNSKPLNKENELGKQPHHSVHSPWAPIMAISGLDTARSKGSWTF